MGYRFTENEVQDALAVVGQGMAKDYGIRVVWHGGARICVDLERKIVSLPRMACASTLGIKSSQVQEAVDRALNLTRAGSAHEFGHCAKTKLDPSEKPTGTLFKILNSLEDVRMERVVATDWPGYGAVFRWANDYHNKKIAGEILDGKVAAGPLWEALCACIFQCQGVAPAWTLKGRAKQYYDLAYQDFTDCLSARNTRDCLKTAKVIYEKLKHLLQEEKDEQKKKREEREKKQKGDKGESGEPGEGDEGGEGSGEGEEKEGKGKGKPKKSKKAGKSKSSKADKGDEDQDDADGSEESDSDASGKADGEEEDDASGEGDAEEGDEDDAGSKGESGEGKDGEDAEGSGGSGDDEDSDEEGDEAGKGGEGGESGEGEDDGDKTDGDGKADGKENESRSDKSGSGEAGGGKGSDNSKADEKNKKKDKSDKGEEADEEGDKETKAEIERQLEKDADGKDLAERGNDEIEKALKQVDPNGKGDVYTSRRDTDIHKTPDLGATELSAFNKTFDEMATEVAAMTMALEQALRAMTRCRKEAFLRSGRLDNDRLVEIAKNLSKNIFYQKRMGKELKTAVAMVVDQSGSMSCIRDIRDLVILLSECMNRLGIPFEIIGTTTKYNYGDAPDLDGFSRTNPIVYDHYKQFEEQWPVVRARLMHMDSHKHNIDGEAVEYVSRRLMTRHEDRKIVFSLCDGEPCGGHGNDEELARNIKRVAEISRKMGVEVYGVGIGTERPAMYYGKENFVYLRNNEQKGEKFVRAFTEILTKGEVKI